MKRFSKFLIFVTVAIGISSVTGCGGSNNSQNCPAGSSWSGSACVAAAPAAPTQFNYNGTTVSCPSGLSMVSVPNSSQQACGCPAGYVYVSNNSSGAGCQPLANWASYCQRQLNCSQTGTYQNGNPPIYIQCACN